MEIEKALQGYVEFQPTALVFKQKMPYEVWEKLMISLKFMNSGVQWWIGDSLAYGETNFKENHSQILEAVDYSENGLDKLRWVSQRIEPRRRRPSVNWSSHREVAPLEPEDQDRVLGVADTQKLNVLQVRQIARQTKQKTVGSSSFIYELKVIAVETGEIAFSGSGSISDDKIQELKSAKLLK